MLWWFNYKYVDESIRQHTRVVKFKSEDGRVSLYISCRPEEVIDPETKYNIAQLREMQLVEKKA